MHCPLTRTALPAHLTKRLNPAIAQRPRTQLPVAVGLHPLPSRGRLPGVRGAGVQAALAPPPLLLQARADEDVLRRARLRLCQVELLLQEHVRTAESLGAVHHVAGCTVQVPFLDSSGLRYINHAISGCC